MLGLCYLGNKVNIFNTPNPLPFISFWTRRKRSWIEIKVGLCISLPIHLIIWDSTKRTHQISKIQ